MPMGTPGMGLLRRSTLFFSLLFTISTAAAGTIPDLTRGKIIVADEIPGVESLTAEAVIEKANSNSKLIFIDACINKDRASGYIEESLSQPDINTNCDNLKELVENKSTALLFYCNGVKCGRSVTAIKIAQSCGYKTYPGSEAGSRNGRKKHINL